MTQGYPGQKGEGKPVPKVEPKTRREVRKSPGVATPEQPKQEPGERARTEGDRLQQVLGARDALKERDPFAPLGAIHDFKNLNPEQRQKALKDQEKYVLTYGSKTMHEQVREAANKSSLGTGKTGDVVLHIAPKDLPGDIPEPVKGSIADLLQGKEEAAVVAAMKAALPSAGAWLGLLRGVSEVIKRVSNERMQSARGKEGDAERFRTKVRLLTGVMAESEAHGRYRDAPRAEGYNPEEIQLELYNQYWNYDQAYHDHELNIHKDQELRLQREAPAELERLRRPHDEFRRR